MAMTSASIAGASTPRSSRPTSLAATFVGAFGARTGLRPDKTTRWSLYKTTRIREQEEGTGIHMPIIALTALAMKADDERCLAAGMDRYVSKPVKPDELFSVIEDLMSRPSKFVPAES